MLIAELDILARRVIDPVIGLVVGLIAHAVGSVFL